MWDAALETLRNRKGSKKKTRDNIIAFNRFMEYADANPEVSFAHFAEYIYWLAKKSPMPRGAICDSMGRIYKYTGPFGKRLGIPLHSFIRYNVEVDEEKIAKSLHPIQSPRIKAAISICIDTGVSFNKIRAAMIQDYDEERGVLYGRYQLSQRSMDILKEIKEKAPKVPDDALLRATKIPGGKPGKSFVRKGYFYKWLYRLEVLSGVQFYRIFRHRRVNSVFPYNALVRYCMMPTAIKRG